jgi:hypothetical protein
MSVARIKYTKKDGTEKVYEYDTKEYVRRNTKKRSERRRLIQENQLMEEVPNIKIKEIVKALTGLSRKDKKKIIDFIASLKKDAY